MNEGELVYWIIFVVFIIAYSGFLSAYNNYKNIKKLKATIDEMKNNAAFRQQHQTDSSRIDASDH